MKDKRENNAMINGAILAKAVNVFGSPEHASDWMVCPAIGLNGRRPIDLLKSPEGKRVVEEFLDRLEHGVYQ